MKRKEKKRAGEEYYKGLNMCAVFMFRPEPKRRHICGKMLLKKSQSWSSWNQ